MWNQIVVFKVYILHFLSRLQRQAFLHPLSAIRLLGILFPVTLRIKFQLQAEVQPQKMKIQLYTVFLFKDLLQLFSTSPYTLISSTRCCSSRQLSQVIQVLTPLNLKELNREGTYTDSELYSSDRYMYIHIFMCIYIFIYLYTYIFMSVYIYIYL